MIVEISHGVPSSPFFLICLPKREYPEKIRSIAHQVIILTDPNTKKTTNTELWGVNTVHMEEFKYNNLLSYTAYGVDADTLRYQMEKKYPELQNNPIVEFWLLKKI